MDLLNQLRKEQRSSRYPDRHVFRLTREQERAIIDDVCTMIVGEMLDKASKPEHIATLFGCRVELVD